MGLSATVIASPFLLGKEPKACGPDGRGKEEWYLLAPCLQTLNPAQAEF